ncbi:MAG: hypothetical protein Unbinned4388contig1000_49 [Prokaryotic dsDNA virus sp.]|nr:MAG: hypothetical protein Unbinned4388contig1000_49 [Prokaryotic dsDNA virus sp.]|tara:strand:- start:63311 stop:63481 length:171 start_codon:yes stop_codon:yes gene_type:complete
MRLDYGNKGAIYPNPEDSKGFEQMCKRCHIEYNTEESDAYRYEVYCSEECESEYLG